MTDSFNLQRFVDAQTPVYADVLDELRAGHKATHWMWFIFPQLKELGRSAIAKHYGITSLAEALAYLEHPLLGQRLLECTGLMLAGRGKSALAILGSPDDLKFRSCMTLFMAARPDLPVWQAALDQYFGGAADAATMSLL
ncbi:DUF1810 domain-containing protein [Polaromonas sp.]|uniref:DUF1810 domain-containing protein n=1 Tax=Polaromonas sp. TaxID=1869339 RepID=UPI0018046383|nr:DUF1810 domain-containing protein [Polaromonas sp.]NML84241.1 DUF1810 domain-containing protein [Polaromonas sp.]